MYTSQNEHLFSAREGATMKNNWRTALNIIVGIGVILCLASCRLGQRAQNSAPAAPAAPAPVGNIPAIDVPGVSGFVLFQDDFSDGRADEWTISSAWNVQQTNNVYYLTTSGFGGAWLPQGQNWENYIFRAGVRINAGNLSMNVNVTQSGRYVLNMRSDGLYLLKEYPVGSYALLAQTGPFTMSVPHAVAFASQNGRLQVYVDRILWMDYTDTAPLTRGTIAVAAQDGSHVAVGNVLVLGLSSMLPSGVVQAPPPVVDEPPAEVLAPVDGGGLSIAGVEPEPEVDEQSVDGEPPADEEPPADGGPPSGQPDLVLERITMQPSSPEQGQPMVVAVTVSNAGTAQAGAFNIRWNPEGANFVGCSWDIFGLPPGEMIDMVCDYQGYPNMGAYNWGVTADADGEVDESNEGNNSQSGEIIVTPGLIQEIPPAPENCRAESWTTDSVTIAWDFWGNEENIQRFNIYQGTSSLEGWAGPATRNTTIVNLEQGVQYHFDVRAINDAGESPTDSCSIDVTLGQ
jgi:hypothetical protein